MLTYHLQHSAQSRHLLLRENLLLQDFAVEAFLHQVSSEDPLSPDLTSRTSDSAQTERCTEQTSSARVIITPLMAASFALTVCQPGGRTLKELGNENTLAIKKKIPNHQAKMCAMSNQNFRAQILPKTADSKRTRLIGKVDRNAWECSLW